MYKQMIPIRNVLGALILTVSVACALTSARTPAQAEFPTGGYVAGDFTISFAPDGKYTVSDKGGAAVEGTYTITQDKIAVTDKQGRYACTDPGSETGTYQWKHDGKALAFTKVEDKCEARAGSLTGQSWVQQGN